MACPAFYRMYECADERWLFVAAVSPRDRRRLFTITGGPYADGEEGETLTKLLEARFAEHSAAHWFSVLDGAGVPVEVVDEDFCRTIFDDPDARAARLISETWAGNVGRFEDPGLLVNVGPAVPVVQRGPCLCGEHTREILREHGYSDVEVEGLVADHAVLDAPATRT